MPVNISLGLQFRQAVMLDTIFWTAVLVAILCGIVMICLGLYDDWADEAQAVDEVTNRYRLRSSKA
jgi:uncharacterized membrane protein